MPASGTELAARLAARLCHDFAGPTGGILSGLDLLADQASAISRDEALGLVRESARMLSSQLAFARAAFGAGDGDVACDALEALAGDLFEPIRPTLAWTAHTPVLPATAARVLLNLVQLAAAALAAGGVVHVHARRDQGQVVLSVAAIGPRARLFPEVQAGLAGRWVQGAFVHAITTDAGGDISARVEDGLISFSATFKN